MSKHRIEITVKPKADKSKGKHKSPPRPLIRTGDSPDVLSRRSKLGIRLFDLGQRKAGASWLSIDIQIEATVTGGSGATAPLIRNYELGDFQTVDANFIGTGGNWQQLFRPITKGSILATNSNITVTGDSFSALLDALPDSVWGSGGLNVSNADLAAGVQIDNSNGFIESFKIIDNGTYKITALPDFSASSVAFTPSKIMDVFLVPAIGQPQVYDGYVDAIGDSYYEIAGFFYTTIKRSWLFESADPFYNAFNPPFPDDWTGFYYNLLWLQSFAITKGYKFDIANWTSLSIAAIPEVGLFPVPPTIPTTNPPSSGAMPRYDLTVGGGFHPYAGGYASLGAVADFSGALVAVVQKGNQKYYFWTP